MVLEYPLSMQEFMDRFSTEEACRQYLSDVRWADGFKCPRCSHTNAWKLGRGILKCKKCKRDVSVTAGTIFQGRHLSLRLWFQALWLVVVQKNGVSALGLSRALGIRGRGALGKVLILVAVEDKEKKGFGRIRIEIIPDASAVTLKTTIKKMVEPGSKVRTEEWKGYNPVAPEGYEHIVMKRQSLEPGEDPTPLVHRIAALLKRWLLGTHHGRVEETHLASYLDEFVFRFNRRTSGSRGKLFYRLVQGMLRVK